MGRADSIRAFRRQQLLVAGDPHLCLVAMLSRSRQKATRSRDAIGDSYRDGGFRLARHSAYATSGSTQGLWIRHRSDPVVCLAVRLRRMQPQTVRLKLPWPSGIDLSAQAHWEISSIASDDGLARSRVVKV